MSVSSLTNHLNVTGSDSVFSWLGTFWHQEPHTGSGTDEAFLGTGINVGPDHILAQRKAVQNIEEPPLRETIKGALERFSQRVQYESPTSAVIHNVHGVQPPNNLTKHFFLADIDSVTSWFVVLRRHPIRFDVPHNYTVVQNMESNKTEYGTDCHYYGWSKKPKGRPDDEHLRHFVTFPVVRYDRPCEDNVCRFNGRQHSSAGCINVQDSGTPILCGKDKKLTYIVLYNHRLDYEGCYDDLYGYHVPHLKSELEFVVKHDQKAMIDEKKHG